MEILEARTGDMAVVYVVGRLNSSNAPELDERLKQLVGAGCRGIVIDLARLDHMTSAGFRCLLRAERQVQEAAGKLVLCGLQGLTLELFEVGGFLEMLTIASTREEAMQQATVN
jgi:stage II sporulation protein AA (anti-sigma F factor antagonist)